MYKMMFRDDKVHEILCFESVFNIWTFSVCHHNLQVHVFWPFKSIQKLAALYFEVCFKSVIYSSINWKYLIIPHHTKSGRVLCHTLRTLSVRPSVRRPSVRPASVRPVCVCPSALRFRALTFVSFEICIDIGIEEVWNKWANFVLKQQSYGPWCMSKMICASFPCFKFSTFFTDFLQTLHRHWYRRGVVWDCKCNFIQKQQG